MKFDRSLLSGSTRLLVLALLAEGDCYGYQIIRTLARRSEEVFAFQEGTLYPVLHKLEQDGCVRSYEKESEGRRRGSRPGDRRGSLWPGIGRRTPWTRRRPFFKR